mgnify:FL=1
MDKANNGYWLKFESNSDLGNDSSGNNNDFTAANLATHDQMLDSPTFSSTDGNGGNYSTLLGKLLRSYGRTFTMSEGNLKYAGTNSGETSNQYSTMGASSGKWYAEFLIETVGANSAVGIAPSEAVSYDNSIAYTNQNSPGGMGYLQNGNARFNNSDTSSGYDTYTTGDVIQVAMDIDNTRVWFGKNNTWQNSGDPAAGSNASYTDWTTQGTFSTWHFATAIGGTSGVHICNFGQEGTFAGEKTAGGNSDDTGYGNFLYDPPTGFLALCSGNLPTADAVDPAQTDDNYPQKLFAPKLYTGNGSTNNITGVGFQPDLVWIKIRNTASNGPLVDSSRGTNKIIFSQITDAEVTSANLTAFGSDGFSLAGGLASYDANFNTNTNTYASWSWRANGGTTATNDDGSHTSVVQVDPASSFSIMTCADPGGADTIGHGLGVKPAMYFLRGRSGSSSWGVYHEGMGATKYLQLEDGDAAATSSAYFNDTEPTASVLSMGATWGGVGTMVVYAFANVEGLCKAGSYEGNGNADGTFVYTGFRPAWIMTKSIDSSSDWEIFDNKREGYNVDNDHVTANTHDAEATTDMLDIFSNGFKLRIATDPNVAETYIYLAMAHNPFQYATAR